MSHHPFLISSNNLTDWAISEVPIFLKVQLHILAEDQLAQKEEEIWELYLKAT